MDDLLKGIDVSHWNGHPYNQRTQAAYKESDFIITKATQGTRMVDSTCEKHYQKGKRDGKLLGFYHYSEGGDAAKEAEFFYKHCKGYFGEGIPALDWEQALNKAWGSTMWCRTFATRLHELSGIWPLIYVQASAIKQVASCADKCGLWVAGYPENRASFSVPKFPYSVKPWKTYTIWQFTSGGGVDRDVANLDRAGWHKIATAGR